MKEAINIYNYEAWLLDHMEGRLSAEELLCLKEFTASHPELEIDLEDTELVSLEAEEIHFTDKSALRKNAPFISDERLIAYVENESSSEEKMLIESAAKADATLRKELDLYKRTILVADPSVVFPDKSSLKREAKMIRFGAAVYFRAAAALVLVAALWFLFKARDSNFKGQALASIKTQVHFSGHSNLKPVETNPSHREDRSTEPAHEGLLAEKKQHNKSSVKKDTLRSVSPDPSFSTANYEPVKKVQENPIAAVIKDTTRSTVAKITPAASSQLAVSNGSDDDDLIAEAKKSSFWEKAGRAFRKLNKLGVKQVHAEETLDKKQEQYVLSLGNFSIRKNKYNQ